MTGPVTARTLVMPNGQELAWPFGAEPHVGMVVLADAGWWQTVCFVITGRRIGEEIAYRVVVVDDTHVLVEGPMDP